MIYSPINENGLYLTEFDLHQARIDSIKNSIYKYAYLKKKHKWLDNLIEKSKNELSDAEYKELKDYLKKKIDEYDGGYDGDFDYIFKTIAKSVKRYKERKQMIKARHETEKRTKEFIDSYNIPEVAKSLKFKKATPSDLDRLYNNSAYCIEGYDMSKNLNYTIAVLNRMVDESKEYMKVGTTVYITDGKTMNKYYDLEGDNSYSSNLPFTLIDIDDVIATEKYHNKYAIKARWFDDVVDNNEYREYMKGRHEYTSRIQWIINANSD